MRQTKTGILLANLGTPDAPTPEAVKRYLKQFLSAMGECPQTYMIKARIRNPLILHASRVQNGFFLMCGRSQMSARPDMQAYPSLRPLARCLFILTRIACWNNIFPRINQM